eukprot:CAMPEP_0201902058 /NCGR_PEP_ID=MMETSP0902-20130614/54754_1 /ASSEMBLY_ACC=CAM_ASM_000551 /TAXON_ID=420261 /ORGANISM="Thalassiosira antarctica, Strain CCMP982" /LENGTH=160 /DNA_ID=CAMNT_0048436047 /DNA_START=2675 /DNA_END=3154 /DNA_ORIENTATION=-
MCPTIVIPPRDHLALTLNTPFHLELSLLLPRSAAKRSSVGLVICVWQSPRILHTTLTSIMWIAKASSAQKNVTLKLDCPWEILQLCRGSLLSDLIRPKLVVLEILGGLMLASQCVADTNGVALQARGSDEWYVDWTIDHGTCVKDCLLGNAPCGGSKENW